MPAALLTGRLVFTDPCFTVTDSRGTRYELIWPKQFTARREGDLVSVVGAGGEVWGLSELSFGGGAFDGDAAKGLRDGIVDLPVACDHEPFWLVADVAAP